MATKCLIATASWSGNTREVSELVGDVLESHGWQVDHYNISQLGFSEIPNPRDYDIMMIGTFTIDKGATVDEVKDFIYEIGYKPPHVYVFGTGDTQFGGESLFCLSAIKIAKFYNSKYEVLKIEQSPRGEQEELVNKWAEGVIEHWQNLNV